MRGAFQGGRGRGQRIWAGVRKAACFLAGHGHSICHSVTGNQIEFTLKLQIGLHLSFKQAMQLGSSVR